MSDEAVKILCGIVAGIAIVFSIVVVLMNVKRNNDIKAFAYKYQIDYERAKVVTDNGENFTNNYITHLDGLLRRARGEN